jgi:hypothetical protein
MKIWCTILVFLMIIGCQKQPTQHDGGINDSEPEFFPLDNIRSWTYQYSEVLDIAWATFTWIDGTKNWEYISKAEDFDSIKYFYKEVFNYRRIYQPFWGQPLDTTFHVDTNYFSIIDYKTSQDSIRFIPPFYVSIGDYYIQYNLPLHRYYVTASDSIHLDYYIYTFTLEKDVGIKYLHLFGAEGGHSDQIKTWELINYELR